MALSTLFNDTEPIPPMVSAFTRGWGFVDEGVASAPPSSSGWPFGVNYGCWYPVFVPTTTLATRMWWANSSASAGNAEAGIYYDAGYKPGAKLATTGSVALSGATSVQFAEFSPSADLRLDPGLWWLYMSHSSTTTFFMSAITSTAYDELFVFQQASVAPGSAPDPATPIETSSAYAVLYGFSTNTVT